MFALLGRPPEIKDAANAKPLTVTRGHVRFENVTFSYDPERPILKGLTFEVPAGTTTAVVGPSGGGKSTLSRLLFRFYDVSAGRILIDGQDIRDITQASLRNAIGMVPQDTVLFNDTIRYNIRYGRWAASDAEVEEAAGLAQIDAFIRLAPKGYDTEVGERGLKLSGGEKQRVAIARAIVNQPLIIIADEPTGNLDPVNTYEVVKILKKINELGTTVILTTHNKGVVDHVGGRVITMEAGKIVRDDKNGKYVL